MSTEAMSADAAAAVPAADKPASNKQIVVIAMLALAGTVAGAAAGAMVVAPRVIAHQVPISADSAKALAEAAAAKAEGSEGGKGGEKKVIKVENVIVNPAGTNGTRYLMASFGIEVSSPEVEKKLTENEVQVRDRITTVLQSQNLVFLTAPWARDSVKTKVAEALREITGPKASIKVYVPQFVIQ
jgi:flagellar FliL protein